MSARHLMIALLTILAPTLVGAERPSGLGDVRDVRHWSHPDYTRVVIELSRPIDAVPEVRPLPADPVLGLPERLYMDLDRIWVGGKFADGIPVEDGLLKGLRLGQNTLSKSRLVIDLDRWDYRHRLINLHGPERLVIDIWEARLSAILRPVQTVVIDAGHGGKDPGAIGVRGLREKDVNLALARQLVAPLERHGFQVVLTRTKDLFLNLEERTAKANSVKGDVFLSIHANASPRRGTRGMEIYYPDRSHERHTLRVAARENKVTLSQVDSLQGAVSTMRVEEASEHASQLAELVHKEVVSTVSLAHRGFRGLGVKKGPFNVLFLTSMPAILVETGFLTNLDDARLLRNEEFVRDLAEGIAAGLARYRDGEDRVASGIGG